MNVLEAFQELWSKVNVPGCSCPDIEIGQLRELMAEIFLKDLSPTDNEYDTLVWLSPLEKYIWAYVKIAPGSTAEIALSWFEKHIAKPTPLAPNDEWSEEYEDALRQHYEKDEAERRAFAKTFTEAESHLVALKLIAQPPAEELGELRALEFES
jgi:hypothetical protein